MDLLATLNPAQIEAVTATEGYVRVIAGAGTGKTRALTHRFAYLVNEVGILPGNILCVTFTNKSANEMRQRIHTLTGDSDTGYICTFHSLCVSILQEDSHAVGYPKSFLVLDNSDIDAMLAIIYEERGLTLRDMTFSNARDMIEIKKLFEIPDYYRDLIGFSLDELKEKYLAASRPSDIIFYGYLYQQKKCFGLDYNDLIKFSLYIFEENAEIRQKWQSRLEYIMIDEYQDIDEIQFRLMKVLCDYHKNLFVVGDPDQTIYTWRGASLRYLMEFPNAFPGTRTIMMMQNYRSTPEILAAANDLIAHNRRRIEKNLIPTLPSGEKPLWHHAPTQEDEARWIAKQCKQLHEAGTPWREMTLLYRAHHVTRTIEDVFLKEEIPYTVYSGAGFYDRTEIKDALSYLRMIALKDDLSFLRIANRPKRNLGQRRMKFLKDYAEKEGCTLYEALVRSVEDEVFKGTQAKRFIALIEELAADYEGKPISEVLSALLNRSGYETMLRTEGAQSRLDNLAELTQAVYEYETTCGEECTMEHYLSHVALMTATDREGGDRVKLMTIHTAKGLEFPNVFLCGLTEGIIPSKKTRTLEQMEEERRLAFVALTRAERRLFLTDAEGRNFDGSPRYPSRFVLDIDRTLLDVTEEPRERLVHDARNYIALADLTLTDGDSEVYPVGTRVRHRIFGAGKIEEVDLSKAVYVVQFEGMRTPRSISFRVKMEKM
ncbi:MAG: UvrD-helicase domain-containing protein [Clostridia bacterium]|nr:UvrD-helicase domain-containing protein [Clostridia bacterium]